MTAITVANPDWTIVSGVQTAITGATIDDAAVFQEVRLTTGKVSTEETQFDNSPIAVIQYVGTEENPAPENLRFGVVSVEILVAAKVNATSGGIDEAARIQEAMRLANAVKNAVEAGKPATCHDVADDDFSHDAIVWPSATFDTDSQQPWVFVRVPCELAFSMASPTSH